MEEDSVEKLKKVLEPLSENILFSLKELFHSNFWAWLMRKYPQIFLEVFIGKTINQPKILREHENFDLYITNNNDENDTFVIENKFISMPFKCQLEKYDDKLKYTTTKKILITYINPFLKEFIERKKYNEPVTNTENWNIITYADLTCKLKKKIENPTSFLDKTFDKAIIGKYLQLLDSLNKLQNIVEINDEMTIEEFYSPLKDNNLKSILQLINFEKTLERIFVNKLTHYILYEHNQDEHVDNIDNINIDCGRDHTIYSDILFYYGDCAYDEDLTKRGILNEIGISLWGNNYRYYANINKLQLTHQPEKDKPEEWKKNGHKDLEEKFKDLFNKKGEEKYFKGGYNYKDDMWLYKKKDISNMKIGEIKNMVLNDLKIAYQYIKKSDKEEL